MKNINKDRMFTDLELRYISEALRDSINQSKNPEKTKVLENLLVRIKGSRREIGSYLIAKDGKRFVAYWSGRFWYRVDQTFSPDEVIVLEKENKGA